MKSMITLHHDSNNLYSLHGINHLIQKLGISIKVNGDKKSKINVVYGKLKTSGNFSIQISENKIQDKIEGWLKIGNTDVPIFEKPHRIKLKGKTLVKYHNGKEEFPCVVCSDDRIEIGFDIFKEVGYILSGHLEKLWRKMEVKGKIKTIRIPFLDFYEKILFDSILFAGKKLGIPVVQKSLWPGGKKFALCLTHDVDEIRKSYQYITFPIKHIRKRNFKDFLKQFKSLGQKIKGIEPFWTFEKMMEIEDNHKVRSTLFFLQEDAKVSIAKPKSWRHYARKYNIRQKDVSILINDLNSLGWEIGLHGSFHSYKDLSKLSKEKKELEKVLKSKVFGIRQHNLNLAIPDTWRIHEALSLEYDSTLGFNFSPSFRFGTCFPFRPLDAERKAAISLLEVPMILEDTAALPENIDNWNFFMYFIKVVEKFNGILTLLWHHTVFNNNEFHNWGKIYEEIIKVCKKKDAWVTNSFEIVKWWKKRERNKVSYQFSGNKLKAAVTAKGDSYLKVYLPDKSKAKITSNNADIVDKEKNSITLKISGGFEALIK
jgi:hypothetical protein